MQKLILATPQKEAEFHNNMDYCIGTGRMGLALQQEYLDQLKLVQDEIGFSHIRGHGLFCDDLAIYHTYKDDNEVIHEEYNFTYLDRVMDSYQDLHIRPFLELGFMPNEMASGTQTVFYWKGNVTPPKDYDSWKRLVQATLRHLMERYGATEVTTWPVEVWNEPNLNVFWENADQEEYFKLFEITFAAVKEVDDRFRVGGPAVCGGSDEVWIRAFLEFCREKKIAVDFITRHHYTTEVPERDGHYGYARLSDPEDGFNNLTTTRTITDSFEEYKGLDIHLTEFNTSYIPNCPIHDTNINAAYLALQLSRLGGTNASYSYWTFGDVFEEWGVPFTPFYGGFGLVANGCIPKPTFWTFQFFKQLTGKCVCHEDDCIIVRQEDGSYRGVAWNMCAFESKELTLDLTFEQMAEEVTFLTKTVDEKVCNPLKVWHDLGEPSCPDKTIVKLLRNAAMPLVETKILSSDTGKQTTKLPLSDNAIVYFEVKNRCKASDRGYSYGRSTQKHDEKNFR